MKFSEEALWSVLGSLELLIDLVSSGYLPNENHVLSPDNISLLVRLMVRAQPQNQILTHKILQCVIEKSEHVNASILDEAVRIALVSDELIWDYLNVMEDL